MQKIFIWLTLLFINKVLMEKHSSEALEIVGDLWCHMMSLQQYAAL